MTPERWRQVEEMLHAALARGERERAAFLLQARAGDVALRREVELLLAQQASMGGFLEDRPWWPPRRRWSARPAPPC